MGSLAGKGLVSSSLVLLTLHLVASRPGNLDKYMTKSDRLLPDGRTDNDNRANAQISELSATVSGLLSQVPVPSYSTKDEIGWDDLATRVLTTINQIISEVANLGEGIADGAFRAIWHQLINAKSELFTLAERMDEHLQLAVHHLNESLVNHAENIDLWTAHIKNDLRYINNTRAYSRVCQLVDGLVHASTEELRDCCNITIKPIISLCHLFRAMLANVLRITADILHRMQMCIEDKNSYSEYMTPCLNLAYEEITDLVKIAAVMRQKIAQLLTARILYSRCCISLALVEIEEHQNDITNDYYDF